MVRSPEILENYHQWPTTKGSIYDLREIEVEKLMALLKLRHEARSLPYNAQLAMPLGCRICRRKKRLTPTEDEKNFGSCAPPLMRQEKSSSEMPKKATIGAAQFLRQSSQ